MNEEKRKEVGTSLSQNTYKKYDLTYRRMEEYIQFRFRKEKYKDIPLTEINEEFINGFPQLPACGQEGRPQRHLEDDATVQESRYPRKERRSYPVQPIHAAITFVQVDKAF